MSIGAPVAQPSSTRAAAVSYETAPLWLALAVFALCAFSPAVLNDGDTWSHVATGDLILGHRAVPRVDPFSFSLSGAPWTAHEWLAEALFALAHRIAGWSGVVLLTGAAAGAATFVVARRAARELTGPALIAVMALCLGLMSGGLLARPHILALPVLALWADQLFAARERRAPPLAAAGLMMLWANLHGGFAFGLALIGPFALEALWLAPVGRRVSVFTDWALFAVASLMAALITPFGIEGLLFPLKLTRLAYLAQIKEWQPENFAHPGPLEFALLALIALALTKPLRLAPMRLLLLLGLIHMSLQHMRHETLLAIAAPMLLARPIAEALGARAPTPAVGRGMAFGALALALALTGARLAAPIVRGDSSTAPISALAAVPAGLRDKPVLNNYAFGGYFIYAGLRPFIDGRADMFGDAFLSEYARILAGEPQAVEAALKRWDIAWTIFAPGQRAVATMDHEPGWRRLYADAWAVVHVRAEAADLPSPFFRGGAGGEALRGGVSAPSRFVEAARAPPPTPSP